MAKQISRVSDSASHNSDSSPLLRLPGEIRNQIYGYVLRKGTYILLEEGLKADNWCKNELALLCVCREIYDETKLLPFSLRSLLFIWHSKPFFGFTIRLHETQRQAIRILKIRLYVENDDEIVGGLRACGISSLSDLFPALQSVYTYVVAGAKLTDVDEAENSFNQWVRCGLNEDVHIHSVFKRLL